MNREAYIDRLAEIGARLVLLRNDLCAARSAAIQANLPYVAATFNDAGCEVEAIEALILEAGRA